MAVIAHDDSDVRHIAPLGLALALIFHRDCLLAPSGLRPVFWGRVLVPGYDSGPAGGPGGRGFHGPLGSPSWIAGMVRAGQGGCGSALMRCHAVVIASAHGHVAWIFRQRRRPPRTSRAAACRTR